MTDLVTQYGQTAAPALIQLAGTPAEPVVDPNTIQVRIGGEDTASGRHVLYQFAGRAQDAPDQSSRCDEKRAFHQRYMALSGR